MITIPDDFNSSLFCVQLILQGRKYQNNSFDILVYLYKNKKHRGAPDLRGGGMDYQRGNLI